MFFTGSTSCRDESHQSLNCIEIQAFAKWPFYRCHFNCYVNMAICLFYHPNNKPELVQKMRWCGSFLALYGVLRYQWAHCSSDELTILVSLPVYIIESIVWVSRHCLDTPIALEFVRHIGSSAADVPFKYQSARTILNINLVASRLCGILQ